MYEYITGRIAELRPTHVVVDVGGVGYLLHISLQTYAALEGKTQHLLWAHQVVREDAHLLYGFAQAQERELFRALIGVSGVGANTARMILSSLAPSELERAIAQGDVEALQRIKGIGLKTAQRIVVDLRDRLGRGGLEAQLFAGEGNTKRQEALSALVMLGFGKGVAEKAIDQLLRANPGLTVEHLIKDALKGL